MPPHTPDPPDRHYCRKNDTLNEYLRFRHVFRNAHSFDLDWLKMSPLGCAWKKHFKSLKKRWIIF